MIGPTRKTSDFFFPFCFFALLIDWTLCSAVLRYRGGVSAALVELAAPGRATYTRDRDAAYGWGAWAPGGELLLDSIGIAATVACATPLVMAQLRPAELADAQRHDEEAAGDLHEANVRCVMQRGQVLAWKLEFRENDSVLTKSYVSFCDETFNKNPLWEACNEKP